MDRRTTRQHERAPLSAPLYDQIPCERERWMTVGVILLGCETQTRPSGRDRMLLNMSKKDHTENWNVPSGHENEASNDSKSMRHGDR